MLRVLEIFKMWLIETNTKTLVEFFDKQIPRYAILSHTWDTKEVTFQDMHAPAYRSKAGWSKIECCCRLARADGIQYVWVDTCCIDKTSSAELSEAINSMYSWYGSAYVCDIYLVDVHVLPHMDNSEAPFCASRWFQRGWSLQELIAPSFLKFFDST